jgi:hypothetical protein
LENKKFGKGRKWKIPCRDDGEIKTNGMTKMANTRGRKNT